MRITFVTRKFGNVERNSHCDVLHITPVRVTRLFLDCNGVFAIKAYRAYLFWSAFSFSKCFFFNLYCIVLHCIVLRCVALRCVALRCVALRCVALRCVALRCVALHCIVLYCICDTLLRVEICGLLGICSPLRMTLFIQQPTDAMNYSHRCCSIRI